MAASVLEFIPTIESQRGDRYVFGAETRFSDPNPPAFDCSELVQWGLARVGVDNPPDGAANQWRWCKTRGTLLGSVAEGISTFGALLFRIGAQLGHPGEDHVAVSLGNGQTFEARGRAYGVNFFSAYQRPWTAAGRIPGLDYLRQPVPPIIEPGAQRMDTPDDVQSQVALGRVEEWVRKMHDLDPGRFALKDLGTRKSDNAQALVHNAAERLDAEMPAIFAAYKAAIGT